MVRNKVINYIRDNRSRLIHNYIIVQENGLVQDLEFLSQVEEVSKQQELEKALDSLPPQQRKIIHLRFEGKSNRQIAEEENLSLNTVNVHYRLAMKKLKTLLKVVPLILLILC
jgi:RNA polymerase sigma factor (sigma-70 family)